MSKFRSNKTITRFLISTPSRFVGESETDTYLLTHASENYSLDLYRPNPNESSYRQYFELTVSTPEYQGNTVTIPDYSHVADNFCIALAVLFGKRFDSHGLLLQHGRAYVPSVKLVGERYNKSLSFNSLKERCDFQLDLNLVHLEKIVSIVHSVGEEQREVQDAFLYAGRFYLEALREMECSPEVAFINLVTACEILAAQKNYNIDNLLDDEIRSLLRKIEVGLDDGEKVAKQIKKRLSGISEKFCLLITEHVDEDFFSNTESLTALDRLTSDNFKARLKAAYSIRSTYVHAGKFMSNWFSVNHLTHNEEVISGNPVIEDPVMKKYVCRSPTILGLERIVRYVLIKYLIKNEMITDFSVAEK
ncbi:hypothetical protein OTE47_004227 [Vibrio vulnificus]|uniref:hypothetical protein n=1 Tax=Vibrio rotiferianus TaxID=190895 RepID=UPI002DD5C224|nr:hypothetical protein [Vibrio vulnificus]EKE1120888.1 hypothetical protein [Vibrio vulnificus]EME0140518.1 hypothetical protein [Vibrio vulnificus]